MRPRSGFDFATQIYLGFLFLFNFRFLEYLPFKSALQTASAALWENFLTWSGRENYPSWAFGYVFVPLNPFIYYIQASRDCIKYCLLFLTPSD